MASSPDPDQFRGRPMHRRLLDAERLDGWDSDGDPDRRARGRNWQNRGRLPTDSIDDGPMEWLYRLWIFEQLAGLAWWILAALFAGIGWLIHSCGSR
ncbi:MAG: hypothetical protein ABI743_05975 [bacterium]